MSNPGAELATFVSGLTYDQLPTAVAERTKAIILDTVASAVAGRHGDETSLIEGLATAVGGTGDCTVMGGPRLSPAGAALVNGYQVTAVTVCDVFAPALFHVTPEVIPPAFAVTETEGASGRALITAVAAGLESATRVALGIDYPSFRARGWHSPGVIGPFGGAAAVGVLLGLDPVQQRHAFGLAGSQAAGTFAHWGTPTIKFHQSRGSLSGLLAGRLAAEGFLSSEDILAHEDGGIYHAYSDGGKPELVTEQLGHQWRLEDISLRRWPAASSIQTMLTGLFDLITQHDVDAAGVARVEVHLSPTVHRLHGGLPWTSRFTAQLSAPYLVSIVLHDHRCWLEQFEPKRFGDPQVDGFARDKVQVVADESLEGTASVVRLVRPDGSVLEDRREVPKGDPSDPLSLDEITQKFTDASTGLLPADRVARALDGFLALEQVEDAAELIALLRA